MNVSSILSGFVPFVQQNQTTLLSGVAVLGTVTSVVFAIKATPTAIQILEQAEIDKKERLTRVEIVKHTWRLYVPTALSAVSTIACIVCADRISLKQNAVLAGAYALTEAAAREYKAKVAETLSEKKVGEIREKIADDHLAKNPPPKELQTLVFDKDKTLCYDLWSDRYFYSTIAELDSIENRLNKTLLAHDYVTLNELYAELNLNGIGVGDEMGWASDNMIQFEYSGRVTEDGRPAIVLSYKLDPKLQILWGDRNRWL